MKRAGAQVDKARESDLYRLLRLQGRAAGPRGIFVVAVASHGFTSGDLDYLVTSESVRSDIEDSGVRVAKLLGTASEANTERVIVLLDACREKLIAGTRAPADQDSALSKSFAEAIEQARGQVVLAAAVQNGFAYDDSVRKNGVFTAAILDGLRGGARADARGFITLETLATYVQGQVASWVRKNRRDHVGRSRGITSNVEGAAAKLPLAIDRDYLKRVGVLATRKDAAKARLRAEIGDILTGRLYDDVTRLLKSAAAGEAEPWLERIEALDGTRFKQESLAYFYTLSFRPASGPTPTLQPGDPWTDPVIGMKFRYVPPGTFQMGSPPDEPGRFNWETQHEVTLTRGFWLGETEVTQKQWHQVMGTDPSRFKNCGEACPVETVSWFDAVAYSNALSEKAGYSPCYSTSGSNGKKAGEGLEYESVERVAGCTGYRLPTEAEWERAARAGTTTALYTGPITLRGAKDAPELDAIAWYGGNSRADYDGSYDCSSWFETQIADLKSCGPQPVGTKQPNLWHLSDMLGNVYEWCEDSWDGAAYPAESQVDPVGQGGPRRVLRGGSWFSLARYVRAAYRLGYEPGLRLDFLGFRLARGQGAGQ